MKGGLKYLFVVLMITGQAISAIGQFSGAGIKLEKNQIVIGDQIKAELSLTVPAGSKVQWPMLLDTLTAYVEIHRKSEIDTVSSNKEKFTLKQELIITSFDSGSYVIRPILFRFHHAGDTVTNYAETSPVTLDVQTVKTDQKADIKAIKPPLKAPVTFREILPWILLGLLVIAIAAGIYYFLKRKKKEPPVPAMRLKTTVPPYEAAIEALDELRKKKLWQSGQVKEYYSELTEIVREYIELRYPLRALEMTTSEIYSALRTVNIHDASREKLNKILVLADLVKFAKEVPEPVENEQSINQCEEFVRDTKPVEDLRSAAGPRDESVQQENVK
jgi:hypothetical protein